jgi:hypothetical protein
MIHNPNETKLASGNLFCGPIPLPELRPSWSEERIYSDIGLNSLKILLVNLPD